MLINQLFYQHIILFLDFCAFSNSPIPLLWRGGRPMHFVIHVFSNHVMVLHDVTPIDLLDQSAVLSDEVVVEVLKNQSIHP